MNDIYTRRILNYFIDTFFEQSDNIINKNLFRALNANRFSQQRLLEPLSRDIVEAYASNFTDGDTEKAIGKIEGEKIKVTP